MSFVLKFEKAVWFFDYEPTKNYWKGNCLIFNLKKKGIESIVLQYRGVKIEIFNIKRTKKNITSIEKFSNKLI